jgi:hypothetical protein
MHRRRHIRSALLSAVALATALTVVATGHDPAEAATVSQPLSCGEGGNQNLVLTGTGPATVAPGGQYTVDIAPGSGKFDGATTKNAIYSFQAPAGTTPVPFSAVLATPGSVTSGSLGGPSAAINGTVIQLRIPGPIPDGATVTPPVLRFKLQVSAPSGTVLTTRMRANPAYSATFSASIGSIDITCSTGSPLALTSTTVAATTTTTKPTTTSTSSTTSTSTSTSTTTTLPAVADIVPFASATALIQQQFQDLAGRAPTPTELSTWVTGITNRTLLADDLIVGLVPADQQLDDARLVRLYLAYFRRPPDPSGFAHWTRVLDSGRGLSVAAQQFAESPEFVRTFGSLSNSGFIDLVYQTVLGRAPDATGKVWWLTRLDAGTRNRGDVMVNVSESAENTRKKRPHVDVFRLHRAMLGTFPTRDAFWFLVDAITDGSGDLADVAHTLRHSDAYAARV